MTVKEMIALLSKEPLDAEVLVAQESDVTRHRRAYAVRFAWAKQIGSQFEERRIKVDDQTKTAVVIWS